MHNSLHSFNTRSLTQATQPPPLPTPARSLTHLSIHSFIRSVQFSYLSKLPQEVAFLRPKPESSLFIQIFCNTSFIEGISTFQRNFSQISNKFCKSFQNFNSFCKSLMFVWVLCFIYIGHEVLRSVKLEIILCVQLLFHFISFLWSRIKCHCRAFEIPHAPITISGALTSAESSGSSSYCADS